MLDLQNLITVIVPVRERQYNLPSIIKYYSKKPYRKIIYDASVEKYKGDLEGLDYVHAGPEFQYKSYLNAYKMAKTPYLINCPDDDIMTHESIEKCVSFLESHTGYSACDGEVVEWDSFKNHIFPQPKPEVFRGRILHDWDKDSVLERIRFGVITCSRSCLHGVVRTKDAIEIMQNFLDHPQICPLSFLDRVYTFATLCKGKIKTLPVVQHIRTANNAGSANRVMFNPKIANENLDGYGPMPWVSMEENLDDKHCSSFSHFLSSNTDMTEDEALVWTTDLYKEHFLKRRQNGGGGYFGKNFPEIIDMPYNDPKSYNTISKAIECMQLGQNQ